ncbi:hypothetical protein [Pseudomonas gingeri]|uniref:hypothetical protein n=1 Tax=Pseudomonas gingeri TaxID=117681 RepID=UPI0021094EFB|nr:hypothetical protein [Pseudomonas gingeri]
MARDVAKRVRSPSLPDNQRHSLWRIRTLAERRFRGLPIELIGASLMGVAFLGFTALVKP